MCVRDTLGRLQSLRAIRYSVRMLENNSKQDEYLRSLMPEATEEEIEKAKEAVADFLELIWDMRAERWDREQRSENSLDQWRQDLLG